MLVSLFRRQPTQPDTTTPDQTEGHPIAMRFRTHGGATIDLFRVHWTIRGHVDDEPRHYTGFQWICRGCDLGGRDHRLGWGYSEIAPDESRRHANQHAAECHAMPKPNAA